MKTNLKSGNALVRFLLGHGEKLGILAVGACAMWIAWSALGREQLEKQPSELENLVNQTRSQVTSLTWQSLPEEVRKMAEPLPDNAIAKSLPSAFPNLPRFRSSCHRPSYAAQRPCVTGSSRTRSTCRSWLIGIC